MRAQRPQPRRLLQASKPDAGNPYRVKPPTSRPRPAARKPGRPESEAIPRPAKPKAAKPQAGPSADPRERLHVRIAHSGICSRRKAEVFIKEGRVTVNGDIVRDMGVRVEDFDDVRVDGVALVTVKQYTVILNKPTGVVTTLHDPQGRPTIIRHLPDLGVQLKPVGRLDMDTEGLLICTNDGDLAHRLAHPKYHVEKEYQAIVTGIPDAKALEKLRTGVHIEGGKTRPARVEVIHAEEKTNTTGLKIIIHEGRKRQVRLMCEAVEHPVIKLKRLRIGPLVVKGLRAGECRMLMKKEIDDLKRMVGL